MTEVVKRKSVFDSIRSAFVEEVPDAPKKERNSSPPAPPAPQVHSYVPASTIPAASVAADPNAVAKIEARINAVVPPAYQTFMEQVELLRDTIADEGVRFKAALKTSHTSIPELVSAVDTMLKAADSAHDEFNHTFEDNKSKVVSSAQQSLTATDQLIETREKQIQAIQQELESLRNKRQTDQEHLQGEEQRLEGIRAGFEAAHTQVVGRLNALRTQIASRG